MTPITNLPARLMSVLRERLSPEDIHIIADVYGEGSGYGGSLYLHFVERAGAQQVVRVLVLHSIARRDVMGLVRIVSERYSALQETLRSLGFETSALASSYLAALQQGIRQEEVNEAQTETLRFFTRKADTPLHNQQDRPLALTLLRPATPETAPRAVLAERQLDDLLANHRCVILSHPERAVTAGALRALASRLIGNWRQAPAVAPLPIFVTLTEWFNPALDLHQFLQQHMASLGLPQFAEGLPDQMRSGRVVLLLEGLDALPFLQFSELTGLINDLRVSSIAQLSEEHQWHNVKCILSCQAKNFLFGPNWREVHVLDPERDQPPLLSDNPALTLKTHIDGAFEQADAAGQLPGGMAANELRTCLSRLAFNAVYTEISLRHGGSSLGEGGPVQIALPTAAAWLFHLQELNDLELEPELRASRKELRLAEQVIHWAAVNGLLARGSGRLLFSPEPTIYFPDEHIKNHLCLHYCFSHMYEDPQLVSRLSSGYVEGVWRLWAEFDHALVDKLLSLLINVDSSELRSAIASALRWLGDDRAVEPLISALHDEDPDVRWCIAFALGALGDRRAVDPLITLLKDTDPDVRRSAASALGKIEDERSLQALIEALSDEDGRVRFAVAFTLKEFHDVRLIEPMVALLADHGSHTLAQEALKSFGEKSVPSLMGALTDPEIGRQYASRKRGDVPYNAAEVLGEIGDIRPLPILLWLVEHDSEVGEAHYGFKVRDAAAKAVEQIRQKHQAAAPLLAALLSEDATTCIAAAFMLGILGDRRAVKPLVAALQDESVRIRWGAAKLLGSIGDSIAIAPLIAALADNDFRVSESVADSLHKIGEPAISPLIGALKDQDGRVRSQAAKILGKLRNKQAVEPLIAILTDRNHVVRLQAVRSLGILGDRRALEHLIAIANDPHREVRNEVGTAIHEIDPSQAVPVLIAALEDEDQETRLAAARDLSLLGDSRAVEPLIAALKDEYHLVRQYAGYALSRHGDQRAIEPLIENLQDEEFLVAWAAARALGAIGDSRSRPIEPLVALLRDESQHQCSIVAEALIQFGERTTLALLAALEDEGPSASFYAWSYRDRYWDPTKLIEKAHLHYYAAEILGKVGDVRALPILIWMMTNDYNETIFGEEKVRDAAAEGVKSIRQRYQSVALLVAELAGQDPAMRMGAAFALGMLGDERAVEDLSEALTDTDRRVRWGAARLLGNFGGTQAIAALRTALEDADSDVRRSAIIALLTIGDEQAIASLSAVFKDKESDIRKRTLTVLVKLGKIAIPPLIAALEDEDQEIRNYAAAALIKLGEAALVALLASLREEQSNTHDWLWVQGIAYVLSRMGETALQPLLAALNDQDSNVRYWVANALGNMEDSQAVGPLAAALNDEDPFVRLSVAAALTKLGDDQGFELLLEALKEADEDMRAVAILNLRETRSDRAVELLIATLNDEDKDIRYLAVVVLGEIGDSRALPALEELAEIRFPWATSYDGGWGVNREQVNWWSPGDSSKDQDEPAVETPGDQEKIVEDNHGGWGLPIISESERPSEAVEAVESDPDKEQIDERIKEAAREAIRRIKGQ